MADTFPYRITDRRAGAAYCRHHNTVLATSTRKVYCADCNELLDTFDVLRDLVYEVEKWRHAIAAAEAEAKRKQAKLAEIKRELTNVQSMRVRRKAKWEGYDETVAAMAGVFPMPPL